MNMKEPVNTQPLEYKTGGGGADGLLTAFLITTIAGFIAALLLWLAARTYPADMAKVQQETLIAK